MSWIADPSPQVARRRDVAHNGGNTPLAEYQIRPFQTIYRAVRERCSTADETNTILQLDSGTVSRMMAEKPQLPARTARKLLTNYKLWKARLG